MKEIMIKLTNQNDTIRNQFKNKDIVSIEDLLDAIENLVYDVERLEEEKKELEEDRNDNYVPRFRDKYEEYGVSESDFH